MIQTSRRTLLLGATATALAGGTRRSRAADRKAVTFWYEAANPDQQRAIAETLVKPFDDAHPDLDLRIDYRGAEVDKQLRIALLSGGGPDVVYTAGPSYVATMAQAGELIPLDDYARKYQWGEKIMPLFLKIGTYEGKLFSLPKTFETVGLFYDADVFAKNNWKEPKSLADIEAVGAAMKAKGIIPFGAGNADWRGANEWYVTMVLNNYAGPDAVLQALKGQRKWSDPLFVQAIELLKRWYQQGWFGPNYFSLTLEQAFAQLATGQAGMSPNGTWAFQWVTPYFDQKGKHAIMAPFPTLREGLPDTIYPLGIGSTLSINKHAQNADGAAAVLDAIFDPAFYDRITRQWAGDWNIPIADTSGTDLTKNVSASYANAIKLLTDAVNAGHYGYTTWTFWPPATEEYLINGIEQVWLGKASSAEYLAKLDDIFAKELKAGKVPPLPQ